MELPSIAPAFSVDVRRRLTRAQLEDEYITPQRPVVAAGAMNGSPALGWTLDSITAVAPSRKASVLFFPKGDPYERATCVRREIALEEVARTLRAPRDPDDPYPYLVCDIARYLPELLADARLAYEPDRERCVAFELLAGRDSITSTHCHLGANTLVAQVRGEKRLILYPPEEQRFLYPYRPWHLHYGCTRGRFDRPERYPLLSLARGTQVDLRPGDMLLIPTGWWHAAFAAGESITMSYFWLARGARQHLLRLLPRAHRVLWDLTRR